MKWGAGRGGPTVLGQGLCDTEELRRNWPGRVGAGAGILDRGSECA